MRSRIRNGFRFARTSALCFTLAIGSAFSEAREAEPISPEAARQLQISGVALKYVNADVDPSRPSAADPRIVLVYFSPTPAVRAAVRAAEQAVQAGVPEARWLTGTPLEWQREQLAIAEPEREQALKLNPKQLSAAVNDGADLQVLDVRSQEQFDQGSLPGARHKMPHELDAALATLSKTRWTILIDDGTRVAEQIAHDLYRRGYLLAGWLDGGYPAWVAEPHK